MSKNIEISVILPVYNGEEHLLAVLDSIFGQGVELEVVAVDDGSTDSTLKLLREYSKNTPALRVISFPENKGVAAARDAALKASVGKYLAFCDSDDVLPSGAYRALLSSAEGKDVAIGAYLNVGEDGVASDIYKPNGGTLLSALFFVSCLWNKLISRDFVNSAGLSFDADMTIGEDVVFLAHLTKASPSYAVTDSLVYAHRLREGSLIHTYTAAAFEKHIECRQRLIDILKTREAEDFVYTEFSGFLKDFLLRMEGGELESAFDKYRSFMLEYDYLGNDSLLFSIVGIPRESFVRISAREYIGALANTPPRERVLAEYYSGGIGLRWIVKFFFAWLKYKLSKLKK